jgi:hypothetical protein
MAAFILAHFKNGHDVRMVQERDSLGLVLKPSSLIIAGQDIGLQKLDGDWTVQADLERFVNDSHRAAAQFLDKLVVAEVPHDGAELSSVISAAGLSARLKVLRCIRILSAGRSG